MVLNTLLGCIVFLATNFSLLFSSHLLARRFCRNAPPAVRLAATGVLYGALILLVLQALSPFHAITRTWVTMACLLVALVSQVFWGTCGNFRADSDPIRAWIRDGLSSRWACLILVCGFVVLLSFTRALLMPPLAWDCLTYHLTSAALWVKKGTIFLFSAPDQIAENAYFPINGELFACWLLLPFHSDLLINTMNFFMTFLGGISCYAIARELGLTRTEASFAPALVCFAPMIYSQITTAYVDNATFAFCSAAVLFALRYLRNGYRYDGLLALVAAGIVLGIKYIAIPAVGLIFLAIVLKTIGSTAFPGLFRKTAVVLIAVLIIVLMGGRQYILNTFEAHNPLYPFPVLLGGYEIFQGADSIKEVDAWVAQFEAWKGLDAFSFWEREYRKFLYVIMTAGPKFFLFLLLAGVSLFIRPAGVVRGGWYFLASLWIVPLVLYYLNTSAGFVKRAIWMESSTRFLAPFVALFTIQALVALKALSSYFRRYDFLLAIMVAWDLFYINKSNLWGIEVLYPFMVLILVAAIVSSNALITRLARYLQRGQSLAAGSRLQGMRAAVAKPWLLCLLIVAVAVPGLHLLQIYRDTTRYTYYRTHYDLHDFPRSLVSAWEFLDRSSGHQRIAMTVAWEAPGHTWFFYPLLGRRFQNDIMYISAQNIFEVPARVHRGQLRGNNKALWYYSVKRNKVDFIMAVNNLVYPFVMNRGELFQETWPVELDWMEGQPERFKLVFSDRCCKIFKYTG